MVNGLRSNTKHVISHEPAWKVDKEKGVVIYQSSMVIVEIVAREPLLCFWHCCDS